MNEMNMQTEIKARLSAGETVYGIMLSELYVPNLSGCWRAAGTTICCWTANTDTTI